MMQGGRLFILLCLIGGIGEANAVDINKLLLKNGTEISYAISLPKEFNIDKPYPVLVALPGGRQTIRMAVRSLEKYWSAGAEKHGFIAVAPAAPKGQPFYREGRKLIPAFFDRLNQIYKVAGRRFHLAGNSNGGNSAFGVAVRYPRRLLSLTVLAGFPESKEDFAMLSRLGPLPVSLFVGDGDLYWKEGMLRTYNQLKKLGGTPYFEVIPKNGHFFPDLSFEKSVRIFDHIIYR